MPRSPPSSQSRHRSPQQIWKKSYGFHGFSQLQLRKGWRKFSWLLSIYTGLLHRFVHLHYVESLNQGLETLPRKRPLPLTQFEDL